jgi:cyclophilin family peptidyl-prolyl cis-trans isomerase
MGRVTGWSFKRMRWMVAAMALVALAGTAEAKSKKQQQQPIKPLSIAPVVTPPATPDNLWHLQLSTGGDVVVQLRPDKAPNHVARIKQLTRAGFYDGLKFHRVIDGFMAQTGDPKGTGEGGSPLPDLKAEFNDLPHVRGAASMARAQSDDSANSQFFIVLLPTMRLDTKYTVFGRVTQGMNFVDAVAKGEPPANPSTIVHAWIESDGANAARVPLPEAAAPIPAEPVPVPAPLPAPPKG